MGLFRVTGAALAAGERPALLQLVARRSRIPIAETLLVTPQMTGKGETLAAVFAIVFSFRVVPTYRVPREKLCNIINDRYQLCIIVLSFIKLVEQTRVSLRKFAPDKSVCRFLIRKLLISKGRFFLMINFLFFFFFFSMIVSFRWISLLERLISNIERNVMTEGERERERQKERENRGVYICACVSCVSREDRKCKLKKKG